MIRPRVPPVAAVELVPDGTAQRGTRHSTVVKEKETVASINRNAKPGIEKLNLEAVRRKEEAESQILGDQIMRDLVINFQTRIHRSEEGKRLSPQITSEDRKGSALSLLSRSPLDPYHHHQQQPGIFLRVRKQSDALRALLMQLKLRTDSLFQYRYARLSARVRAADPTGKVCYLLARVAPRGCICCAFLELTQRSALLLGTKSLKEVNPLAR